MTFAANREHIVKHIVRNGCSTSFHRTSNDAPAQHMRYYITDTKYETVMARNIQRVNAVASAAIGLGIAVRARRLARGHIGQDPPRCGWRKQDEVTAAMDGPIKYRYAHLMSSEAFGAPNL